MATPEKAHDQSGAVSVVRAGTSPGVGAPQDSTAQANSRAEEGAVETVQPQDVAGVTSANVAGDVAPAPSVAVLRHSRWLADLAVLVTLALYFWLPDRLTFGPSWLVPGLVLLLLVPLVIVVPERHTIHRNWQRVLAIGMLAILSVANLFSLIALVNSLLHSNRSTGEQLILEAIKIWLINVLVFALWYWLFDRGGPGDRIWPWSRRPDFVFPQMQLSAELVPEHWTPSFIDYLYLSFTNSTAFSPTDTLPMTSWAKVLMLVQALISLLTVAIVASRAVNILGS